LIAEARLGGLKLWPRSSWRAGTAAVSGPPWCQLLGAMAAVDRHAPSARQAAAGLRARARQTAGPADSAEL
jgi:hypothetical protein